MTNETTPLAVGDRVLVVKGCAARGVTKGVSARVNKLEALADRFDPKDTGMRVQLYFLNGFKSGQMMSFYVSHVNRLSDPVINLNDGNPMHKIQLRRKVSA